jgi:hypothetical protein
MNFPSLFRGARFTNMHSMCKVSSPVCAPQSFVPFCARKGKRREKEKAKPLLLSLYAPAVTMKKKALSARLHMIKNDHPHVSFHPHPASKAASKGGPQQSNN